ncbi:MAG TPA: hypothetical protein VF168_01120 [Trueperaceae bacterium]
MFERNTPGWRVDAKWLSGILLVLTLVVFVPLLGLSQLTARERALPLLEGILRLTLMPPGSEGVVEAVREEVGYRPGEPLEVLPGTGVVIGPDEIAQASAPVAARLIAQALSVQVIEEGAPAVVERLSGSPIAEQFARALDGSARDLVRASLLSALMPSGLDNGSRLANWPLQAQRNPGEPVQPVVGVFVRIPPAELRSLNERQIGERVVVELADILMASGLEAAREQVTNVNLTARLTESATGAARERLEELFGTMLVARHEEIGERLEQARAAIQAQVSGSDQPDLGVVRSEELAGLTPESANALVIGRLAERAYEGGSEAVLAAIEESEQSERLASVAGLMDALSRQAHARYLRNTWLAGLLAILLLAALVTTSRGWGRLANPGLALIVAASGGALLSLRLAQITSSAGSSGLPTSIQAQGVFGYLLQLAGYAGASLPAGGVELMLRNHLALLVIGGALVVSSVLLRFMGGIRPRRRSFI